MQRQRRRTFPSTWDDFEAVTPPRGETCPLEPCPEWLDYRPHLGWSCRLCWKVFTDAHEVSTAHLNRVAHNTYRPPRAPREVPGGCYLERRHGPGYWNDVGHGDGGASGSNGGAPAALPAPPPPPFRAPPGLSLSERTPATFNITMNMDLTRREIRVLRRFVQEMLAFLPESEDEMESQSRDRDGGHDDEMEGSGSSPGAALERGGGGPLGPHQ